MYCDINLYYIKGSYVLIHQLYYKFGLIRLTSPYFFGLLHFKLERLLYCWSLLHYWSVLCYGFLHALLRFYLKSKIPLVLIENKKAPATARHNSFWWWSCSHILTVFTDHVAVWRSSINIVSSCTVGPSPRLHVWIIHTYECISTCNIQRESEHRARTSCRLTFLCQ